MEKDLLHGSFQGFWWNNQCSCRWSDGKPIAEHTFEEEFKYTPATIVGTLLRKVDEDNNSAFQEGSFDEGASIPSNDCMVFDPKYKDGDNRLLFLQTILTVSI